MKSSMFAFSVIFLFALSTKVALADSYFSIAEYTKRCGGAIYAKCDSPELNQGTIFEAARARAIRDHVDIMVVVGADWCPSCKEFSKMVAEDKSRDKLLSRVVMVELNGDLGSTRELAKRLKFSYVGYPQAFIIKAQTNELTQQFYPSTFFSLDQLLANLDLKTLVVPREKPMFLGSIPASTIELPIDLSSDYGVSSFYRNPKSLAEQFVNQGVAALNVYHYVDAYRSFRMAETHDQNLVMAKVGQVLSVLEIGYGDDRAFFALQALDRIENIAKSRKLTDIESAWFEFAKSHEMSNSNNYIKQPGVEIKPVLEAYENVVKLDKHNLEGHSLITWSVLSVLGEANGKKLFESVLKVDSNNIGALHALMHYAEMENDAKAANIYAVKLAGLVPNSAHMQHMYGHTLPQQGRWSEALVQFKKADAIHLKWASKNQVPPEHDWHYSHNLDLLAATYLGLGDLENARKTWEIAKGNDSRAMLHFLALGVISLSQDQADMLLKSSEDSGWKDYLKPLRDELELKPGSVSVGKIDKAEGDDAKYQVLVNRIKEAYLQGRKMDVSIATDIKVYLGNQFKSGGFDGWSNAYLELLRIKRISGLLDMKSLINDLDSLEFAVKNGSLCGQLGKKTSVVPCRK